MPYIWTLTSVAFATSAGLLLTHFVPLPNVSMVFLLSVLFAAVSFGLWPALLASVLSFLSYNFFFIEPLYTFSVAQPESRPILADESAVFEDQAASADRHAGQSARR